MAVYGRLPILNELIFLHHRRHQHLLQAEHPLDEAGGDLSQHQRRRDLRRSVNVLLGICTRVSRDTIYLHILLSAKECPICNSSILEIVQCRQNLDPDESLLYKAKTFADDLTADHKILGGIDTSRKEHEVTVLVLDIATRWLQAFSSEPKASRVYYPWVWSLSSAAEKSTICISRWIKVFSKGLR